MEWNIESSWNGPTGLKDDLSLKTCVQMVPLIGGSFLMDPDWNQKK